MDFIPLLLSLKLSFVTAIILLVICFPVSLFFGFGNSRFIPVAESFFSLPLVLPPTVIGFYLLVLFSPRWILGSFLERTFNIRIIFSFSGMLIASCIYSMPFMIQSLTNGFRNFDRRLIEASYVLGKGKPLTLLKVIIPNVRLSIITGMIMTFAHTMGEFGVIMMIGGNIPGVTEVASIYIYNNVEKLDYAKAHAYSLLLIAVSLTVLIAVNAFNRRRKGRVCHDGNKSKKIPLHDRRIG